MLMKDFSQRVHCCEDLMDGVFNLLSLLFYNLVAGSPDVCFVKGQLEQHSLFCCRAFASCTPNVCTNFQGLHCVSEVRMFKSMWAKKMR